MSDPKHETEAFRKARNGRNIALFVGLMAFVIIVFIVTITRLGGNVASHGF
jgi:t-SNARE complex subunit (syntaxin)